MTWWQWWFLVLTALLAAELAVRCLELLALAIFRRVTRQDEARGERAAHEAMRKAAKALQARAEEDARIAAGEEPAWPYGDIPLSAEETGAMPRIEPRPRGSG